jgi:hypothetical protein
LILFQVKQVQKELLMVAHARPRGGIN